MAEKSVLDKLEPGLVFYDLETTGLVDRGPVIPDILQIGAIRGTKVFRVYVRPEKAITEEATAVNDLTFSDGVMKKDGEIVDYVTISVALKNFLGFLRSGDILVGHYIELFDNKVLLSALRRNSLADEFLATVTSYINTHTIYKAVPGRRHSLENLNLKVLDKPAYPKDGVSKARVAKELLEKAAEYDVDYKTFIKPYIDK